MNIPHHKQLPLALQLAGPDNWHRTIAPTDFPLTEAAAQAVSMSIDSTVDTIGGISDVFTLHDLAAAATILANAIANTTPDTNATRAFKEARFTARTLDTTNKNTPRFSPDFMTYRHLRRAIETNNPTVLTALLVDFIRIATHIIEKDNNAPTIW